MPTKLKSDSKKEEFHPSTAHIRKSSQKKKQDVFPHHGK
jgi:hypothetical protein